MTDRSYNNWSSMSDKVLAKHIGSFVKEKRMEMNKTQDLLAHAAGISRSTLSLLEKGETVTLATLLQVLRVLDQLHILDVFSVQPTVSPIQLAKIELKKRKRASGRTPASSKKSTW
ncbi:MAG: helix-turn-helix transcriptional regulator [Chitinophagaceae bacterium]|nr:helix-turn-helix transcriptional regulator [Chitinophagaceae bacterium]